MNKKNLGRALTTFGGPLLGFGLYGNPYLAAVGGVVAGIGVVLNVRSGRIEKLKAQADSAKIRDQLDQFMVELVAALRATAKVRLEYAGLPADSDAVDASIRVTLEIERLEGKVSEEYRDSILRILERK